MDRVLFGILVHDLGKCIEYDCTTPAFTSTPIGMLTNHIVLGCAWVYEQANKWKATPAGQTCDAETFKMGRAELIHVVAAHHGTKEWGSPHEPSTLEAVIVHQLDLIDSRVMHAIDLIENKPGTVAGFTEKSYIAGTCFKR
jgi:3'-5' exoribonuclease